jgi:hypothetical protein
MRYRHKKTPLGSERGLPLDRKPDYLFLLFEAFSGFSFAFEEPESALM